METETEIEEGWESGEDRKKDSGGGETSRRGREEAARGSWPGARAPGDRIPPPPAAHLCPVTSETVGFLPSRGWAAVGGAGLLGRAPTPSAAGGGLPSSSSANSYSQGPAEGRAGRARPRGGGSAPGTLSPGSTVLSGQPPGSSWLPTQITSWSAPASGISKHCCQLQVPAWSTRETTVSGTKP